MKYQKQEVVGSDGVNRYMLAIDGGDPSDGIPLLDLGGLELPEDIETELRRHLWAHGIREYGDALVPGASTAIADAIRSALKVSVRDIIQLCEKEHTLIMEVGYGN